MGLKKGTWVRCIKVLIPVFLILLILVPLAMAATSTVPVDANGNMGVGTTVPAAQLHVGGGGTVPNAMPITGNDLYVRGNIEFDGKIYGDGSALTGLSSTVIWPQNISSATNMNVFDNGTAANTYLSFRGTHNAFMGYLSGAANTSGIDNTLIGYMAGNAQVTNDRNTFIGASAGLLNQGNSNTFIGSNAGDASGSGTGNILIGYNAQLRTDGMDDFLNIGNTIYGLMATDNVGISTSAPIGLLDVNRRLNVLSNGNVGIGTVVPSARLEMRAIGTTSSTAAFVIRNSNSQRNAAILDDGAVQLYNAGAETLRLASTGAEYYSGGELSGDGALIRPSGNLVIIPNHDGTASRVQMTSYVGADGHTWASVLDYGNESRDLLLVKDGYGNVGIGTAMPAARLHVGTGAVPNAMTSTGNDLYVRGNIELDGKIYGDGSALTGIGSSQWTTSGSNIYYNTGNVGIGTASPLAPLHVSGTGETFRTSYNATNYNSLATSSSGVLSIGSNGTPIFKMGIDPTYSNFSNIWAGGIAAPTSTNFSWQTENNGNSTWFNAPSGGYIAFTINNNLTLPLQVSNGNVRIGYVYDSTPLSNLFDVNGRASFAGNVGVGTVSPAGLLDVFNNISGAVNDIRFRVSNTSDADAVTYNLGVNADLSRRITSSSEQGVYRQAFVFSDVDADTDTILGLASSSDSGATWSPRLVVQQAGNIGIGTISPTARLEMVGAGTTSSVLIVRDSSKNIAFMVDKDGGVGVGSTPPPSWWTGNGSFYAQDIRADSSLSVGSGNQITWGNGLQYIVGADTGTLRFVANNISRMFIDANGNIGIGSTAPAAKLYVGDAGSVPNAMSITGSDLYVKGNIEFDGKIYGDGSALTGISGGITGLNAGYISRANSSTTIVDSAIYQNGNYIGIGTVVPSSKIDITTNSLGTTQAASSGLALVNTTPAAVGAQQISPAIRWSGSGWGTTAGTSQAVDFRGDVLPAQGTTATGTWRLASSLNGGAYTNNLTVTSSGNVQASGFNASINIGAAQIQGWTGSFGVAAYRTTDAGSNVSPRIMGYDSVTAGSPSFAWETTNQLVFLAGNGTRLISRAGIQTVGLTNAPGSESGDLAFLTQSGGAAISEKVRISSAGNTGIGTSGPRSLLEVGTAASVTAGSVPAAIIKGNLMVDGKIYGDGSALTGLSSSQWTTNGSNIYYNTGNVGIGSANPAAPLDIYTPDDITAIRVRQAGGARIFTINSSGMIFSTTGTYGNTSWGTVGQLEVYNQLGSRVGLYLQGMGATQSADLLQIRNNSLTHFNVDRNGNVGIGTASPAATLDLLGDTASILTRSTTGIGQQSAIQIGLTDNAWNAGTGPSFLFFADNSAGVKRYLGRLSAVWENGTAGSETGAILFTVRANSADANAVTERMRITSSGNVGINTSAPLAKLVVAGAGQTTGRAFEIDDSLYNPKVVVLDNGNVGISSTNPRQKLEVAGSIEIGTTSSATTGVIYKNGTRFIHSFSHPVGGGAVPSGHNVFIGEDAGNFTTGSTATAGYQASRNIAVGSDALKAITIGYRNTAVGDSSLPVNTEGTENVAIGYLSLYENVTGNFNTAVGANAGRSAIASDNVFIGRNAGNYATGSTNTIVGSAAGSGVSGSSTYSFNALFGNAAGAALTTGSFNTFIGNRAGEVVTTGNYNIVIGYNINPPSNTDSNQLVIGNLIFGTGISGLNTTLSPGNIGIGTNSPLAKLQVGIGSRDAMSITGGDLFVKGNIEFDGKIYGDGSALTGISGGITGLTTNYLTKATSSTAIGNSQVIDDGTNVGIGTANPSGKFNVVGSYQNMFVSESGAYGGWTIQGTSATTGSSMVRVVNSADNEIQVRTYAPTDGGTEFGESRANSNYIFADGKLTIATRTNNDIIFGVNNSTESMRIVSSSGNIGIGTAAPVARLELVGAGTTSATSSLVIRNSSKAVKVAVLDTGCVGIGTSAPTSLLDVNGIINVATYAIMRGTSYSQILLNHGAGGWGFIGNNSPGVWSLGYTNTSSTAMDNSVISWTGTGNVGIGTVAPDYKLRVSGGDIKLDDSRRVQFGTYGHVRDYGNSLHVSSYANLRFYADSDNAEPGTEGIEFYGGVDAATTGAHMIIKNTGNVGIGTTAPWSKATIRGAAGSPSIVRGAPALLSVAGINGVEFAFTSASAWPWAGSIQVRDVLEGSSDGAYPLALNPLGGNVGIGTTAPTSKLEVNGDIEIQPLAMEADHTGSGTVAMMQVDVNTYGAMSCLHMDTDGNWIEADADAATTMPCSAMALESGTGLKKVLLQGFARDDTWNWTPGALIYMSTTDGTLTATAPSGTGDQVQVIGVATHADRIYFNPSYVLVEIL